jgi:hypothetical protein
MRLALLAAVVASGLTAPAAHACTPLPASSAKYVPVSVVKVNDETKRTALRVCVDGRTLELARGVLHVRDRRHSGSRIGAASAAGSRVAWVEDRHVCGIRSSVVTLAAVGRKVRIRRRFTTQRVRTRNSAELDVLLTRQGDLAWLSGTYDGPGEVAVKQPGKPTRRLFGESGYRLAIEDGRTLRWYVGDTIFGFFDLRSKPCPSRSGYTPFGHNDRVILTRGVYGDDAFNGTTVVRGCDPSTGHDRVLLQNSSDFSVTGYLTLVGLDRTWAVFFQDTVDRDGGGPAGLTVADVVTGRSRSAYTYNGSAAQRYPAPTAAEGFSVTDEGVLAWMRQGTLYALVANEKIIKLDEGGTIAGLHAEGDAVVWTHDGASRRVVPPQ